MYNEALAESTRAVLKARHAVVEKRMFGGLSFMLNGHMCCGVLNDDLIVRIPDDEYARALKQPHARPMDFTGKPMKNMVYVNIAGLRNRTSLKRWVDHGIRYVSELPAKAPAPAKTAAPAKASAPASFSAGEFKGFSKATPTFLKALAQNNSKAWFDAHRPDYEAHYLEPALRFIEALGPQLRSLSSGVQFLPKVNGSLFRIQRDVRFAKDKTPYKPHLDLWFWEGEKKGWDCSGFFFRLAPTRLTLGAGMHHFDKPKLEKYRSLVIDSKQGPALEKMLKSLTVSGAYELGGPTRKTVPKGFDPQHPRAALLLREGLVVSHESKLPKELGDAAFVDYCMGHYRALAPLHEWLVKSLK